jgi:Zn-dependent protease/predicted transcriptional regulator
MGGSWRIGRIVGIDVFVHPTFLLLLGWVVITNYLAHGDAMEAFGGLVFILALFGIVVLHELGHALAARRFGIRTRGITLLPIGGIARLERIPEDPWQELVVALAGPAVNVVIASVIYLGLLLGPGVRPVIETLKVIYAGSGSQIIEGGFFHQLFWVNVSLVVFNMIPAFPMDGGRVFRALLAMRLDYVQATQTAAVIGQGIAILFGLLGLFSNAFLIFIAIFVWIAGASEACLVQLRSALGGIPVGRVMITEFETLSPHDPLSEAVSHVLAGFQQDFPVVENGELVGLLTRNELAASLGRLGADTPVGEVMHRDFTITDPREMLQSAFARLQQGHSRSLPVVKDGKLVGVLTADNLAEVLLIQDALRQGHRPALFGAPRATIGSSVPAGEQASSP